MTTPENSKRVLVRVLDPNGLNEQAGLIADEVVSRPVTISVNRGGFEPGEETLPGLVLIGDALEPLARSVGRVMLKIMSTDEMLWLPINARRDPLVGYWSVECVPLVAWLRLSSRSDEAILEANNYDAETGTFNTEPWRRP